MVKSRRLMPENTNRTNYQLEWLIQANESRQEIEFEKVGSAIKARQEMYGLRTRVNNSKQITIMDLINDVMLRLEDMKGESINVNADDYKKRRDSGDYSPCKLVAERRGAKDEHLFKAALAPLEEKGMLASQIAEKAGKELEQQMIAKVNATPLERNNPESAYAMSLLPKHVTKSAEQLEEELNQALQAKEEKKT